MTLSAYFLQFSETAAQNLFVLDPILSMTESGEAECYIKGRLMLVKNHILHVAEFVTTEPTFQRLKYRFHLQSPDGKTIRRWDNAPHHPHISTFPHHCHLADGRVIASPPMDLSAVLNAIIPLLGV